MWRSGVKVSVRRIGSYRQTVLSFPTFPDSFLKDFSCRRDVGFYVFVVGRDGDVPVLAVACKFSQFSQHGRGVLGAEGDDVYDFGVDSVACDSLVVERVPHHDGAFADAAKEPVCIEGWYVGSLASVQYHGAPFFLT